MADVAEQRLAALRRRWEEDRSSAAFVPLAEEYRRLGRVSEAVAVLEQGMKAAPNYLSARVALGRCRLDLGDARGAATILEQAVQQDPTQLVASKLLVEAYLRDGRPEQARERLNLYAVLNDRDPELDELRRRVQQGIREREAASAEPERPAPSPGLAAGSVAPAAAAEPVVPPPPAAAPEPVWTAPPAAVAPVDAGPARGDVFSLPPTPAPALDIAALPRPVHPPAPRHGQIFAGLGRPEDRRRYAAALAFSGVFGEPRRDDVVPLAAWEEPVAVASAVAVAATLTTFEAGPEPTEAPPPVAPWELPPAVEPPRDETPPFPGDPALRFDAGEPLEASAPAPAEPIPPTATLGELYLRQGHPAEAQDIFERVLEAQPDNPVAREGLESARRQSVPGGVTARKIAALQSFLRRVRQGSERHVS